MSNTIITKNNTVAGNSPTASELSVGELAVNTADKKIFTKDSSGAVVELASGGNLTTNALYEHSYTISSDYSVSTGNNAMSVGEITINSGTYVEVAAGSTWAII